MSKKLLGKVEPSENNFTDGIEADGQWFTRGDSLIRFRVAPLVLA